MPDAYDLYDGRYLQERTSSCGAGGLHVTIGPVPAGKVWTIFQAYLSTSVGETQNFWFSVVSRAMINYPVTLPQEFTTDPAVSKSFPMLREGMELKLFPGEYLRAFRAAATADTIAISAKFSETDLPPYRYIEPMRQIPTRRQAHGQSLAPTSGGTSVVHPPPPPPPTERGRRGSPEPK